MDLRLPWTTYGLPFTYGFPGVLTSTSHLSSELPKAFWSLKSAAPLLSEAMLLPVNALKAAGCRQAHAQIMSLQELCFH